MTHPTDEELDALVGMLQQRDKSKHGYTGHPLYNRNGPQAVDAITALRAQLAEAQETWPTWALQIKAKLENYGVDPGDEWNVAEQFENWLDDAVENEVAEANARADRAEAALAAQIEADAWQPIDTAPTDYTHVIGIDAKGCVARTWFFAPSSLTRQWLRVGLPGKAVWHPTHWKPLRETTAQPHDRTALDRMLRAERENVLREAVRVAQETSDESDEPQDVVQAILAMIEQPKETK